jgi:hypothetical protein
MIRDVTRDPTIDPDDKRQRIDATYLQMIEVAKHGNEVFACTALPRIDRAPPSPARQAPQPEAPWLLFR